MLRGFTEIGAKSFHSAHELGILDDLVESGRLVPYSIIASDTVPEVSPSHMVIEVQPIPFVSTPCEWSFSMLKDAALLTLRINLDLIDDGFILKDASAFNVTFQGSWPIFMDHGSIDVIGESGIWAAYGQFVDHFLNPLMLEAYAGVSFQARLRGGVDGIDSSELRRILGRRARLRRGVLTHVVMRSKFERSAGGYDATQRLRIAEVTLPRSVVKRTIEKMHKLISGLGPGDPGEWTDYEDRLPYEDTQFRNKRDVVSDFASSVGGDVLLDIGANTGIFSRGFADRFSRVVAIDFDAGAVDKLYLRLKADADTTVTPIVIDLLNPTPAVGWRNHERASFLDRCRGDVALWLAIFHHLTITGGVPLSRSLDLMSRMTRHAVIEFVRPEDPMVAMISSTAPAEAPQYSEETFMRELESRCEILRSSDVSPTRSVYLVRSFDS